MGKSIIYPWRGADYTAKQLVKLLKKPISAEALRIRIKKHGIEAAMTMDAAGNAGKSYAKKEAAPEINTDFGPFDHDLELKRRIKNWQAANMSAEEMTIKASRI